MKPFDPFPADLIESMNSNDPVFCKFMISQTYRNTHRWITKKREKITVLHGLYKVLRPLKRSLKGVYENINF